MSKKEDFYDLLEIDKKASEDEIRKSYKKLALKYHPDKNPNNPEAENRFKLIAEAYATLSDPQKRRTYDMFGSESTDYNNSDFSSTPFNPFDIFNSMFDGQSFVFEKNVDLGDILGGMGGGNGIKISVHTFGPSSRTSDAFAFPPMGPMGQMPFIDISKIQSYMSECGIDVDEELEHARNFGMPNIQEMLHNVQSLKARLSKKNKKKNKNKEDFYDDDSTLHSAPIKGAKSEEKESSQHVKKEKNKKNKKNKKEEVFSNEPPAGRRPTKEDIIYSGKPEALLYDLYASLKDIYNGETKAVEYSIFKNGNEVKKSLHIPLKGRMVLLENGGNLLSNYELRGDVVFNIYQNIDSEDSEKDSFGFTRINEYDLLIHKKFNFKDAKNGFIYINLFDQRLLKCSITTSDFKHPYIGVIHNYGLFNDNDERNHIYILFSDCNNDQYEEIKESNFKEIIQVNILNADYKDLFQNNN
jgi:DnaJ-class molecular chaperone